MLINDDLISLTFKESKLLEILAANPNVVVSRDDLQKLVWEDEGVIVGRSLDVFISKLRKKLDQDPRLTIVSEHGKGYVLRVDA
ncbi:MAG: winged helix-turn-helix domain-containing protein [Saprospiraceae bacterium]|nr:winged helix-turn-helix domain-containing protein [Saprospiraceae bacterium]